MPINMCFIKSLPILLSLEYVAYTNFVVMMTMLVVVTTTKMQLVEASQHFLYLTQCSLTKRLTLIECENTNPTSTSYKVVSSL